MDPSQMASGWSRETNIRRDAFGRWFNGEDPIDHPNLVRAFEAWLDLAEDGRYCLHNDINWAYVQIEGPPYFVRAVHVMDDGVRLHLSGDRDERLDPRTLRQDAEGALYCDVRDGRLAARFDRHAMVQLMEAVGDEDDEGPVVIVDGTTWRPPVVDAPLSPVT